jgi:hypothetical protein
MRNLMSLAFLTWSARRPDSGREPGKLVLSGRGCTFVCGPFLGFVHSSLFTQCIEKQIFAFSQEKSYSVMQTWETLLSHCFFLTGHIVSEVDLGPYG